MWLYTNFLIIKVSEHHHNEIILISILVNISHELTYLKPNTNL